MPPKTLTSYINRCAYYRGKNRYNMMDSSYQYEIVAEREDSYGNVTHVMFDNGQWVGINSIELVNTALNVNEYGFSDSDLDKVFSDAAGGPREMIANEITRLEARLVELKSALKVIDSL